MCPIDVLTTGPRKNVFVGRHPFANGNEGKEIKWCWENLPLTVENEKAEIRLTRNGPTVAIVSAFGGTKRAQDVYALVGGDPYTFGWVIDETPNVEKLFGLNKKVLTPSMNEVCIDGLIFSGK